MRVSRRQFSSTGLAAAVAFLGLPRHAAAAEVEEAIMAFTGGAAPSATGIALTAPEEAEDGNLVLIEVDAPGAEAIMVFAADNPAPEIVTFNFAPDLGAARVATRIRLARDQDVIAVARMADGGFVSARSFVRVLAAGCGGV